MSGLMEREIEFCVFGSVFFPKKESVTQTWGKNKTKQARTLNIDSTPQTQCTEHHTRMSYISVIQWLSSGE